MNEKGIGEIRRHLRRDRCNMTAVYGCYVNDQKEIVSEFRQSLGMMPENESDKYFTIFRRVLSGGVGRNLIDIHFTTQQVMDSPEHKALMQLRTDRLQKDDDRREFYQKIIGSVDLQESYLILIGCDSYDVPFKSKDGANQADASDQVYTYIICAVCPVKQTKAALHYVPEEKNFHDGGMLNVVSAPELGFLFPAFDDRSTNIYSALYYTHSPKQSHEAFADALFHCRIPKPAAEQKKSFEALLTSSLDTECSLDVIQSVHDELCQRIQLHKESKVPDPLLVSKEEVKDVLKGCGVSEPKVAKFSVDFDETFGYEAELHPKNIIDSKRIEIHTPDVSIKVAPDRSDLIQTRIIGGVKYILICADGDVEVNGVSIHIGEEEAATV